MIPILGENKVGGSEGAENTPSREDLTKLSLPLRTQDVWLAPLLYQVTSHYRIETGLIPSLCHPKCICQEPRHTQHPKSPRRKRRRDRSRCSLCRCKGQS